MKVAIAVRGEILPTVTTLVSGEVLVETETSKDFRRAVYEFQPDLMVMDHRFGNRRGWKPLPSVPRIIATKSSPLVIALMDGVGARERRIAAMAGCYDAIDLSVNAWREDLAASLRLARQRRREKRRAR